MPSARPEITAPLALFVFLAEGLRSGRGALVTMTAREGSSVRSLGSHMAVLEDGTYAGSFSGGCIEAAIVAEAQEAIREGAARTVRYGKGSRFIDIRLPCGGGVDLLFQPSPPLEQIEEAMQLLTERLPVVLELSEAGLTVTPGWRDAAAEWAGDRFLVRHAPPLRLQIAGEGGECLAMARLARAYGAEVELMTPDDAVRRAAAAEGIATGALRSLSRVPELAADPWTALVLLFHSHEWELAILEAALVEPLFWIGAMGSAGTHQARLDALAERGVPEDARSRVRGPIGLIPATRDPATLALSALAEIAGAYQEIVR